jgi:CRISPR/Cas system CSM-associated protein Csm3 (group 7 of RAMP superfamily)
MITRMQYSISLTTRDPLRVGRKEDPLTAADNPVTVVGDRVCIPGPSLKGALRAAVERYLNEKFFNQKNWALLRPCIPSGRLSKDEQQLVEQNRFRGPGCHYPCGARDCRNPHGICPVCYLLGAQGLVGFVRVPFLFTDVSYSELYSARIDRSRQTVASQTNRSYQQVPPEAKFTGLLEVVTRDSLLDWRMGKPRALKERTRGDEWLENGEWPEDRILTELIVDRLKELALIGGYKSKGFGRVSIEVTKVA